MRRRQARNATGEQARTPDEGKPAGQQAGWSEFRPAGFRAFRAAIVWLTCAIWLAAGRGAEPPQFSEYQVKGAFLTKFAMFVEWPSKPAAGGQTPLVIGILGDDPFGPQFEAALTKEAVNGRPFALKHLKDPQEASGCQILFISASEAPRLSEILAVTRQLPILTVGDQDRFAHRGGMINFVKQDGKMRFQVNAAAVEAGGLKMSAKLLQVAIPVTPDTKKGEP
jgi:hypothetical protein